MNLPDTTSINEKAVNAVKTGIYFLFQDEELVYIGQSKNVYTRIGTHLTKRPYGQKIEFNKFAVVPVEATHLKDAENLLITYYKPKYNLGAYQYGNLDETIKALAKALKCSVEEIQA